MSEFYDQLTDYWVNRTFGFMISGANFKKTDSNNLKNIESTNNYEIKLSILSE